MDYRAAGARFVKKVEDHYRSLGYAVQRAGRTLKRFPKGGRWIVLTQQEDLFGAFDLIATHQEGIHFAQVTIGTGARISDRKKKVEAAAELFPPYVFMELWTRPGRGEMKCETWRKENKAWE